MKKTLEYDSPVPSTRYENVDEAARRLVGGVVIFNNLPYIVANIREGMVADLSSVNPNISSPPEPVSLEDPGFNYFKEFPTGYLNVMTERGRSIPSFFDRIPARRVRHSLASENSSFRNEIGSQNWATIVSTTGFAEMTQGIYPTIDDLFQQFNPNNPPKGMSGHGFALSRNFCVILRSSVLEILAPDFVSVGWIVSDDTIVLPKRNHFMEQQVTESGVFNGLTVRVL